jgi:hypothetical protein
MVYSIVYYKLGLNLNNPLIILITQPYFFIRHRYLPLLLFQTKQRFIQIRVFLKFFVYLVVQVNTPIEPIDFYESLERN